MNFMMNYKITTIQTPTMQMVVKGKLVEMFILVHLFFFFFFFFSRFLPIFDFYLYFIPWYSFFFLSTYLLLIGKGEGGSDVPEEMARLRAWAPPPPPHLAPIEGRGERKTDIIRLLVSIYGSKVSEKECFFCIGSWFDL